MSDEHKMEGEGVEEMIRGCRVVGPSRELDFRVGALLAGRGRWRGILVPAFSFAAGVLGACAILLPMKFSTGREGPTGPLAAAATAPASAPEAETAPLYVVAEPHQTTEQLMGTVDGVPVRFERTQTQFVAQPGNEGMGKVMFSDIVTIGPPHQF